MNTASGLYASFFDVYIFMFKLYKGVWVFNWFFVLSCMMLPTGTSHGRYISQVTHLLCKFTERLR